MYDKGIEGRVVEQEGRERNMKERLIRKQNQPLV